MLFSDPEAEEEHVLEDRDEHGGKVQEEWDTKCIQVKKIIVLKIVSLP